ncbi:MAG: homoserine dehydrogenase [bacterium]
MVIKIGILGCGTVGSGLLELLKNYPEIQVQKVAVRDLVKAQNKGLLSAELFTNNPEEIITDPDIEVVVELMGGIELAKKLLITALNNKKHIVTANKDLIATAGEELFVIAQANGKTIFYEAAVAGGIPIITNLKQSLKGNVIKKLFGIINGTTNFILDQMKRKGASFSDALAQAQELGYAESDPTNDVDAHDAAYKIAILASIISGKKIDMTKIYREGIRNISQADIKSAEKRGYAIKLLAIALNEGDELDIRVHPVFVPKEKTLANVNAENNAVMIDGSAVGELTFIGRGAGSLATASSVLGDLLMLMNQGANISSQFMVAPHTEEAKLKSIDDVKNPFYIRVSMHDKVGVLKDLGLITERNNANVRFIDQYEVKGDSALADFMIDPILEKSMKQMLKEIQELPSIKAVESVIRVLDV